MDYLIIGDIHGCYYTFRKMIDKHWNRDTEAIIQVGDLIDRGRNAPEMVELAIQLSSRFPDTVTFLKGNHEYEMIKHFKSRANYNWLAMGGSDTVRQYEESGRNIERDVEWMRQLPLYWENDALFVSHAGIAEQVENPLVESDALGILWNRSKLDNVKKLQIIGHTPGEKPHYDEESNTWNIDTGAVFSNYLTGLKVTDTGEIIEFVKVDTDLRDLNM